MWFDVPCRFPSSTRNTWRRPESILTKRVVNITIKMKTKIQNLWMIKIFLTSFFTPTLADRFSLESEWQQVSRTRLSILTDLYRFSHQRQQMNFLASLRDRKCPQDSRTRLSILADLNNAVVCMVVLWPLISKSSSPFTNFLPIVPSALITIGITVIFRFQSCCSSYIQILRLLQLIIIIPLFAGFSPWH